MRIGFGAELLEEASQQSHVFDIDLDKFLDLVGGFAVMGE